METFPQIYPVTSHTDHVGQGSTFVAVQGFKEDGLSYIPQALERGATTLVLQEGVVLTDELQALITEHKAQVSFVSSTRKALAELSAAAYGYPARSLRIIGITGTKGKTTSTYLLEHILRSSGISTARLSTVKNRIVDTEYEAPLTTPQPDYLHTFFSLCKERGVTVVVMEVAAQALSMHRIDSIEFDEVVFTNFSLEHSEFYPTMDEYFQAKCSLFGHLKKNGLVVLNGDDEKVGSLVPHLSERVTISMKNSGTYTGTLIESTLSSLRLKVAVAGRQFELVSTNLLGEFSAYNLLASCAVAARYGISSDAIQLALKSFQGVPGRLNSYTLPNGAVAVIDNAHTPSSFEAFFKAVKPLSKHIIAVFGAGGDRDALKRPIMGAIASEYADQVFLTTDNPRSEEVSNITQDILCGVPENLRVKVAIEYDRERAIRTAYAQSNSGSLIVLLGKGPVEYQDIQGTKIPFSEAAILRTLRS